MAGVDRILVVGLANEWAESSAGNKLSNVVALVGIDVEVSQDWGHPVEGPVVTKKSGVRDDLKQGGRRRRHGRGSLTGCGTKSRG